MLDEIEADFDQFVLHRFFELNSSIRNLAHYTSSETALSILKNNSLWMNNINQMNDPEEFVKGRSLTREYFKTVMGKSYRDQKIVTEIISRFDKICFDIEKKLFCISFSEFDTEQYPFDSLELWDRYGDSGKGLCLVFGSERLLLKQQTRDPIFWLPMIYGNEKDFSHDFNNLFQDILSYYDEGGDEENDIIEAISRILVVYAMMYKNIGFKGENEFRLVHSPVIHPQNSDYIKIELKNIRGDDREVAIVGTNLYVSRNNIGISFNEILDFIIIGPKNRNTNIEKELRTILDLQELYNTKIIRSSIPYR